MEKIMKRILNYPKNYIKKKRNMIVKKEWEFDVDIPSDLISKYDRSVNNGYADFEYFGQNKNVILCAQPKSASLYTTQLIALSLKYKNFQIGFNKAGGSIYYPRLLASKFCKQNTISHCHANADKLTINFINKLNLKPIVLTRNLLDAIVSRRDMLIKNAWAGNFLTQNGVDRFLKGSVDYQIEVIIELFASSYINFFQGWKEYSGNMLWITYNEVKDDAVSLIGRVSEYLDEKVDIIKVKRIIKEIETKGGINYNKGMSGRGLKEFSRKNIDRINQLANIYQCVDYNFLGIR